MTAASVFMPSGPAPRCAALLVTLLAAAVQAAAAQAAEESSFVILAGADTFAVESFTQTPARIQGEIAGRAIGRMAYSAAFAPGTTVSELELRAWPPGAGSEAPPQQQARLSVRGDSATAEITTSAGVQTQRFGTRTGASLYLNPSMALVEPLVRRARELGGERAEIPVLLVQGGATLTATVTGQGADSVVVTVAGTQIRAAVSSEGRMLGGSIPSQNLTIVRVAHALPTTLSAVPPDYSAPTGAPYTAEEVVVETPAGHRLVGTLTRPVGGTRMPAVVTITGSGAQERDQAIPTVSGYRPFREFADTLARRGIAVLRLDDRGTGASTGDFAAATSADFADDVRAALEHLRARPDIDADRLGLLGHSEGGMIAPMVAATDTAVAAIVLLAGTAQTGREIIAYQQRQAIESNPAIPAAARDSVFADAQQRLFAGPANEPWLRFFLDYDPLPTARRVRHTPVLILHGETDRQVTVEQANSLAAAFRSAGNTDVTVRVVAGVNHLLLRDPDGSPAGYPALPDRAVVPEVRGAVADWLAARLGSGVE